MATATKAKRGGRKRTGAGKTRPATRAMAGATRETTAPGAPKAGAAAAESALSTPEPEQLREMTDEQLTEEGRAGLRQAEDGRRAVALGAVRTGGAFAEMKRRCEVEKKKYTDWLEENFDKTPQTARLYVRLYENRGTILKNGWEELSLRALSRLFAETPPGGKKGGAKKTKTTQSDGGGAEGGDRLSDDDVKLLTLIEDSPEAAEVGKDVVAAVLASDLMERWGMRTVSGVVFRSLAESHGRADE